MAAITPPVAIKRVKTTLTHGIETSDPYHWLRADNWEAVMRQPELLAADIRQYLEAENSYTEGFFKQSLTLQEQLFQEMKGRIKEDDSSVPMRDGAYYYYTKYVEGGEYPVFCRKKAGQKDAGSEEILLDGNKESQGQEFFDLGTVAHSPDHRYLAYAVDCKGSEFYTIRVRDLETGAELADCIENAAGDMTWGQDSKSFLYIHLDKNHRSTHIMHHRLGDAENWVVYHEQDPGFFLHLEESLSGKYIFIHCGDHQTSEIHIVNAHDLAEPPQLMRARQAGVRYEASYHEGYFYIRCNTDGAKDFKICRVAQDRFQQDPWQDWLPHKPGCLLEQLMCFKDYMVREQLSDGLPQIVIHSFADGEETVVEMEDPAYSLALHGSYEYATDLLRFSYSSPRRPKQVIDYRMKEHSREVVKEQEVPSGHQADDYVVERRHFPSHDGAEIPVTLLYRKDTSLSAKTPLLLYGYGSYGVNIPAAFRTVPLSLVDRGFVYAVVHTRGSMLNGYHWYEEGKGMHKKNTFLDFIAAADGLIKSGYTSPECMVAQGGSAGGMLMGAVTNMRPDLFKAVIANVPFVDVLNTMLDASLPLTPPEWPEWGNPIASKETFEYIRSYSPYDNVRPQAYPHIFVSAGLTDPRVTYWEPAKWVAKLRQHNTSDSTILLHTNMQAGHSGSSGRFDVLKEDAREYAFALMTAGGVTF